MAHEIQKNDKLVLVGEAAWHGLGQIVPDHMTPTEAAQMVFPWTCEQRPLTFTFNGQQTILDTHCINVRSDDGSPLGVVSSNYQTFQPQDMADFAEALLDQGTARIETAGSIRGGKRIWFLMKGEEFAVANGDAIFPYLLLSNGYDGLTTLRVTPTTVRAVCSNTLHMSIPRVDRGELCQSAISIRHTVNLMDRIQEAKTALKIYGKALDATKELMNGLAAKPVNSETVQKFFLESYTADFGAIPENPKDGYEKRRVERATSAWNSFSKRFDDERNIAGASVWNMMNAYSGLVQHDQKARGRDDIDRVEKRVESNMFGLNQTRTQAAAQRAFRVMLGA